MWPKGRVTWVGGPKVSHHCVKFCGHRHCDSGIILFLVCHLISQDHVIKRSYAFFNLSRDLNAMTPPTPAWLASFELTPLDVLPWKFRGLRSYGNGDINSYINSYMNILEKAELTALTRQTVKFPKSGITIFNCEATNTTGRKKKKKNKGNCKALCVPWKCRKKWVRT